MSTITPIYVYSGAHASSRTEATFDEIHVRTKQKTFSISRPTSPRWVFSNLPFTIRAEASLSLVTSLQLIIGVLMTLAALIISLIRGTPRVTFMEATPAKWKVFKVICVPGSPMDCAPTAPTVEPGSILALTYFAQQMSKKTLSCSSVTLHLLSTIALAAALFLKSTRRSCFYLNDLPLAPMDKSVSASHSSSRWRASNIPLLFRISARRYAIFSVT